MQNFELITIGETAAFLLWLCLVITPMRNWQSALALRVIPVLCGISLALIALMKLGFVVQM